MDIRPHKKHNWFVNSSVVVEKDILIKAGKVHKTVVSHVQDAKTWKKCLEYTNSVYVDKVLVIMICIMDITKITEITIR